MPGLGLNRAEQWDFTLFVARHADENPDEDKLGELLLDAFPRSTATRIGSYLKDLESDWNYDSIIGRSLPIYRERVLPAFHHSNGEFDFAPAAVVADSVFWKQCLCLLALWKFPGPSADHRPIFGQGQLRPLLSVPGMDPETLSDVQCRMRQMWVAGRTWLDKVVSELRWCPPDPFDQEHRRGSVEELSMYIFVRSHLAWEDQRLVCPVPIQAIRSLLEKRIPDSIWPNQYYPDAVGQAAPSLRGSALAVTALGDWFLHRQNVAIEHLQCASSKDPALFEESDLENLKRSCRHVLASLAEAQLDDGSWPDSPAQRIGDLRATSQIYYAYNRFSRPFELDVSQNCIDRAERWLFQAVTERIRNEPEFADRKSCELSIQEVAVATTALARQSGLGATIWLRQAIRWLFVAREQANQLMSQSTGVSFADIWLLYSVVEIIRREKCAQLVETGRAI